MKWALFLLLSAAASLGAGQEIANPYELTVNIYRTGERFQISASYVAPISVCSAYAFLTDYEGARNIPGIIESKIIGKSGNKVKVERLIEDRILFIPIEMRSVVEYTETPNQGLLFEQISGDAKFYKGSWRIVANGNSSTLKYESIFEPGSIVPNAVIEYFIKNSIRERFEVMAENASQRNKTYQLACK
jgi:hypothetical protein